MAYDYIGIVNDVNRRLNEVELTATNFSTAKGEYSMIKAASQNNWIKEMDIVMEITNSIKRAGADIIITYHALDIADRLNNK